MKTLSLLAVVVTLGLTLAAGDADAAKRFGAGKSAGMQRQADIPNKAPAATPAQAPTAATNAAPAQSGAAAATQAQPRSSWMGPVAGLAAGIGLAALASHFGFGEELASMLMIGMLVLAVIAVVGLVMRRRAAAQPSGGAGFDRLQYAAAGRNAAPAANRSAFESSMPATGSSAVGGTAARIPAEFDAAGFVRNAKVNFMRLQAANDAGNLDDIRAFTTPEMFAEIRLDILERGGAAQETDVVSVDAEVIEVAEEPSRYIVSVRFHGLIREDREGAAQPFDEIWNMTKPRDGGGWVIAGIQQIS